MTERQNSTTKKVFPKATVTLFPKERAVVFLFSATKSAPNGSKTRALLSLVYA
jgi:hypothetical protein